MADPKKKAFSGRSGASVDRKGKFKEAKAPEGWGAPAITVRSGKDKAIVYSKPSKTGQTFLTKQSNDKWIKTKAKTTTVKRKKNS